MADDILKNIPLPADLPENWTSDQIVAPTGAEVGLDTQHGYNYLMRQVNNAQKAATALNEGKLGLHDTADDSNKLGGYELRLSDHPNSINVLVQTVDEDGSTHIDTRRDSSVGLTAIVAAGPNYVRFIGGTQICWGYITFGQMNPSSATFSTFTFAVPFANTGYAIMSLQTHDVGGTNFLAINLVDKTTTGANVSVYNSKSTPNDAGVGHDCIAIGRWK